MDELNLFSKEPTHGQIRRLVVARGPKKQKTMKRCTACLVIKKAHEFTTLKNGKLLAYCKLCAAAKSVAYYHANKHRMVETDAGRLVVGAKKKPGPQRVRIVVTEKTCSRCSATKSADEFHAAKNTRDSLNSQCKSCSSEGAKEWRKKNPARVRAVRAERRTRMSPAERLAAKAETSAKARMVKYGLTRGQLDRLFTACGRACTICRIKPRSLRELHIDHDHSKQLTDANSYRLCSADAVFGCLCAACNTKLEVLRDAVFLEKAQRFLARGFPAQQGWQ